MDEHLPESAARSSLPDGEGSREGYPLPAGAEHPHPSTPTPVEKGASNAAPHLRNKRAIARQATSAVACEGEPPAADDPLLAFAPVPHSRPRRNSITPDLQRRFIAHLAATGIVSQAARHIGRSLEALYKLRQRPGAEGFRAAWDMAVDRGVERLEDSALARAIAGEKRMVVSAGKLIGTEIRHNEALTLFFLRNRLARRYAMQDDVGPGHPLYERVRRDHEKEVQRRVNDPEQQRMLQNSLNAKLAEWRRAWEKHWEAERAGEIGELPGPPACGE